MCMDRLAEQTVLGVPDATAFLVQPDTGSSTVETVSQAKDAIRKGLLALGCGADEITFRNDEADGCNTVGNDDHADIACYIESDELGYFVTVNVYPDYTVVTRSRWD